MIYAAAIFWLTCSGILLWLAARAPEGWEDELGFHEGRQPDPFRDVGRQQTDAGFVPKPFSHASELPQ